MGLGDEGHTGETPGSKVSSLVQGHSVSPCLTPKFFSIPLSNTTSLTQPVKPANTHTHPHTYTHTVRVSFNRDADINHSIVSTWRAYPFLPHSMAGVSLWLRNTHANAVINLLESEPPPPTWAIFQPFSGIITRDKDVNISPCGVGRRPEDSTLVNSLWEAAQWVSADTAFSGGKFGGRGIIFGPHFLVKSIGPASIAN